ncbi:MAG: gliding motility-associated C-terminal domain-containing protein [Bacteroidales bacterium]|nr:gliding motility-associated C-terminal domain-containing protein [Bacteroidales bacterium]
MTRFMLIVVLAFTACGTRAQIDNLFWFAAPDISPNHAHDPITFCFTSFSDSAKVTVTQPANPSFTPKVFNLAPYSYRAYDVTNIESSIATAPQNTVKNTGFKITSTSKVTTYFQLGANNSEIYTLKGRNGLGTDFIVPMQNHLLVGPPSDARSSIEIVATENNTTVTIVPSQPLMGNFPAGVPIVITLDAGQTYCIKSATQTAAGHLGNTRITSDKPIAVNSTDDSVASNQIPGYSGQDLVAEQITPIDYAGDLHIALWNNRAFESVFVFPTQDSTNVYINGGITPAATLDVGEQYTYMLSSSPTIATMITSDKPVIVFQLTGSEGEAGGTQLPALGCTGSQEVVYARPSYSTNLRLSIVVPTAYVGGFTMTSGSNNVAVPASYFTTLPYDPEWSYCYRDFTSSVPTQAVMKIQNSLGPFHLGVLDYYTGMSSSLGYFSDYSSVGRLDIAMRDTYCLHDSVDFTYFSDNIDTVYLVTPAGDTIRQSPLRIHDLSISDTGTYYLLGHSIIGCEDTWVADSIDIKIVNSYKPDLGDDFSVCAGEVVTLAANYSQDNVTYLWNTGDSSDTIEVISAGQYILHVSMNGGGNNSFCESSDTINIGFHDLPRADFEADVRSGCTPVSSRLAGLLDPATDNLSYQWFVFDENFTIVGYFDLPDPVFTFEEEGTFSVKLVITTPEGCRDSLTKWNYITASGQPEVEFTASPEVSMMSDNGGVVEFTAFVGGVDLDNPGSLLTWDFGDGQVEHGVTTVSHPYTSWGDYIVTLTMTTNSGCHDSVSHYVVIEDNLIFPNIITPNGDGVNDVWAIGNLNTSINEEDPDRFRSNRLRIYDRWGGLVYKADNYDTYSRDGDISTGEKVFDGAGLSDGVYYFTFTYKGKAGNTSHNGSITIVR